VGKRNSQSKTSLLDQPDHLALTLVTVREVRNVFGVSRSTVYRWIDRMRLRQAGEIESPTGNTGTKIVMLEVLDPSLLTDLLDYSDRYFETHGEPAFLEQRIAFETFAHLSTELPEFAEPEVVEGDEEPEHVAEPEVLDEPEVATDEPEVVTDEPEVVEEPEVVTDEPEVVEESEVVTDEPEVVTDEPEVVEESAGNEEIETLLAQLSEETEARKRLMAELEAAARELQNTAFRHKRRTRISDIVEVLGDIRSGDATSRKPGRRTRKDKQRPDRRRRKHRPVLPSELDSDDVVYDVGRLEQLLRRRLEHRDRHQPADVSEPDPIEAKLEELHEEVESACAEIDEIVTNVQPIADEVGPEPGELAAAQVDNEQPAAEPDEACAEQTEEPARYRSPMQDVRFVRLDPPGPRTSAVEASEIRDAIEKLVTPSDNGHSEEFAREPGDDVAPEADEVIDEASGLDEAGDDAEMVDAMGLADIDGTAVDEARELTGSLPTDETQIDDDVLANELASDSEANEQPHQDTEAVDDLGEAGDTRDGGREIEPAIPDSEDPDEAERMDLAAAAYEAAEALADQLAAEAEEAPVAALEPSSDEDDTLEDQSLDDEDEDWVDVGDDAGPGLTSGIIQLDEEYLSHGHRVEIEIEDEAPLVTEQELEALEQMEHGVGYQEPFPGVDIGGSLPDWLSDPNDSERFDGGGVTESERRANELTQWFGSDEDEDEDESPSAAPPVHDSFPAWLVNPGVEPEPESDSEEKATEEAESYLGTWLAQLGDDDEVVDLEFDDDGPFFADVETQYPTDAADDVEDPGSGEPDALDAPSEGDAYDDVVPYDLQEFEADESQPNPPSLIGAMPVDDDPAPELDLASSVRELTGEFAQLDDGDDGDDGIEPDLPEVFEDDAPMELMDFPISESVQARSISPGYWLMLSGGLTLSITWVAAFTLSDFGPPWAMAFVIATNLMSCIAILVGRSKMLES